MKACSGCGEAKPLGEFYADRRASDGRKGRCKPCVDRAKWAWEKEHREVVNARKRRSRSRNPITARRHSDTWKERNREKYLAQEELHKALMSGEITKRQSCEWCGRATRLHGHHEDYSQPLSVIWLCPKCHKKAHLAALSEPTEGE